jgi:hypothetical protein
VLRQKGDLKGEAYTGSAWAVLWSPESYVVRADAVVMAEGNNPRSHGLACGTHRGRRTQARARGLRRNLGDLFVSSEWMSYRVGPAVIRTRPAGSQAPRGASCRSESIPRAEVLTAEATRPMDGQRGVGAPQWYR